MFYVYILHSESSDKYYVGFTENLEERIGKHNRAHSGFTGKGIPWKIIYKENYASKTEAMKREKAIKSWKSRKKIEELISKKSVG